MYSKAGVSNSVAWSKYPSVSLWSKLLKAASFLPNQKPHPPLIYPFHQHDKIRSTITSNSFSFYRTSHSTSQWNSLNTLHTINLIKMRIIRCRESAYYLTLIVTRPLLSWPHCCSHELLIQRNSQIMLHYAVTLLVSQLKMIQKLSIS